MGRHFSTKATDPMAGRPLRVAYFVAPGRSNEFPVELELLGARRRKNGDWGAWKKMEIPYEEIARVESEEDAAVLRRILGVIDWRVPSHGGGRTRVVLRAETFLDLVPRLATRGRLLGPKLQGSDTSRRPNDGSMSTKSYRGLSGEVRSRQVDMEPTNGIPIEWDAAGPWTMTLALHDDTEGRPIYHSRLRLVRNSDSLSPDGALYFPSGFALMENVLRHVQGDDVETWADAFHLPLEIDESDVDEFITAAAHVQGCPSIQAPESYRWNELSSPPVPRLVIAGPGEVPAPWRPGGGTSAGASTRRESTGVSAGASSSSSASPSTGASTNQSAGPSAAPSSGHRPPVGSWEEGAIGRGRLAAYMEFAYGDVLVDERCPEGRVLDTERRTLVMRHRPAEAEALRVASELGVTSQRQGTDGYFSLQESSVIRIVDDLVARGWQVWAKDSVLRTPQSVQTRVSSGIDWFGVRVAVSYEGFDDIDLAAILAALKKGERTVRLGDGTVGFLPEDWLRRNGLLLDMGKASGGELQFGRHQAPLLDALLSGEPHVETDERFEEIRAQLRSFDGIAPVRAPKSFQAELRPYQEASLAWFAFLRQFGFGGCLADDMGLGKTIMTLALLDSRRTVRGQTDPGAPRESKPLPSLVVVPRSVAFNWIVEGGTFAPKLRILDFSGTSRGTLEDAIARSRAHLVLTTYGVLRRDIEQFRETPFDYVILDESQTIKNAKTSIAKAVRLLNARHRLALSGTPIENHIGELWSLFAFLNPGLLGSSQRFHKWATMKVETEAPLAQVSPDGSPVETADGAASTAVGSIASVATGGTADAPSSAPQTPANLLAAAVRPFILRRTKAQVAPQLPERTEQTVYCTLGREQRKLYDSLRAHYETLLLSEEPGGAKPLIVLEGLLRLRQAACHSSLIDPAVAESVGSSKLDLLVEKLGELREEGHKALVFSQFVSLLTFVRGRLDAAGIRYEYLDGKTRNRAKTVERFQNDPELDVFLISLKAGGTGLNLTAATYVFLLDPWWNPAVEAQAIDRAHRIGQERSVLACRVVARDTVEERILELQARKRQLADSIIQEDSALMKNLQREDLEFLLR